LEDEKLTQSSLQYLLVLSAQGWLGHVNIQPKPDFDGNWKAFELNLRMSGDTSSRLQFG